MIVVRDVFQLKFGKAREAAALWQEEGLEFLRKMGARDVRLLTDLAGGQYYTLVLESTHENLSSFESEIAGSMNDPQWRAWYQRFVPLVESGHREILSVVGSKVPPSPKMAETGAKAGAR